MYPTNGKSAVTERRTRSNSEPLMDISLPSEEWFDEMYGPSTIVDICSSEKAAGKKRNESPKKNSKWKGVVVELSDEEDESASHISQPNDIELLDEFEEIIDDVEINSNQGILNEASQERDTKTMNVGKTIQRPQEMQQIILTQSQLNKLADNLTREIFHNIVVGCYVCVNFVGFAENINFIDRIEKVLEAQSYQHIWFNRRFRLCTLGDIEIEQIVDEEVQNDDICLKHWFSYMQAKDEIFPTREFIKEKHKLLFAANMDLKRKEKTNNDKAIEVNIKRENLEQILLNPETLRKLAKLDFESFKKVVINCFVCMPAFRRDKAESSQYHIVRIVNCRKGHRSSYKVRNIAEVDYELEILFYGHYIINWIKEFPTISDDGFSQWIEDMKSWKDPIPTLDEIRNKAAELQLAYINAASKISFQEGEKYLMDKQEHTEKMKLPVQLAKDLEQCLLTRQQLQKLTNISDIKFLSDTMTGCFVRLKIGTSGKYFQIDQIVNVDVSESKLHDENEYDSNKKERSDQIVVLKYAGTLTYSALIAASSAFKFTEQEFQDWLRRMHDDLIHSIPTIQFVETKGLAIRKALESVADGTEQRQLQNENNGGNGHEARDERTLLQGKRLDNNRDANRGSSNRRKIVQPYNAQSRLIRHFNKAIKESLTTPPSLLTMRTRGGGYFIPSRLSLPTTNKQGAWPRPQRPVLITPGMDLQQIQKHDQNKMLNSLRFDDWRLRQHEEVLRKELLNIPGIFPPAYGKESNGNFVSNASAAANSIPRTDVPHPPSQYHFFSSSAPTQKTSSSSYSQRPYTGSGVEPINFVKAGTDLREGNPRSAPNYNQVSAPYSMIPTMRDGSSGGLFSNVAPSPLFTQSDHSLSVPTYITTPTLSHSAIRAPLPSTPQHQPLLNFRQNSPQPPPVIRFY